MANQGQGWHGDSEEHREAAEKGKKDNNWLPLLLIPLALVIGWTAKDALDGNRNQAMQDTRAQYGVGGSPGNTTPCITPGSPAE